VNFVDSWGRKEYVAVTTSMQGSVTFFGGEGGGLIALDVVTGTAHRFEYVGGSIGFGIGLVGSVETGVISFDKPEDVAGLGMNASAWAAAGPAGGASGQVSSSVYFDVDADAISAGGAYGYGASVSGGITYTWYRGEVNLADLPKELRELLEKFKEQEGK